MLFNANNVLREAITKDINTFININTNKQAQDAAIVEVSQFN